VKVMNSSFEALLSLYVVRQVKSEGVGCLECYTATEGCLRVYYLKTTKFMIFNMLSASLDEFRSVIWIESGDMT
jgi:hypothetical protein